MIGKIKGKLVEVENNIGLIETTCGVYYQVYLPQQLISFELPYFIELYTFLHAKEDTFILYGFADKKELDFFKLLLTVPNVGPKTAFTVISYSKIEELVKAVKNNDIDFFSQIPSLGKKTAMKIILEISQKLKSEFKIEKMYLTHEDKMIIDALVSLGFGLNEAKKVIPKLPKKFSIEKRIKEALKMLK